MGKLNSIKCGDRESDAKGRAIKTCRFRETIVFSESRDIAHHQIRRCGSIGKNKALPIKGRAVFLRYVEDVVYRTRLVDHQYYSGTGKSARF
jgi:hypothetical protein